MLRNSTPHLLIEWWCIETSYTNGSFQLRVLEVASSVWFGRSDTKDLSLGCLWLVTHEIMHSPKHQRESSRSIVDVDVLDSAPSTNDVACRWAPYLIYLAHFQVTKILNLALRREKKYTKILYWYLSMQTCMSLTFGAGVIAKKSRFP